jgi:hypothetical protein
MSIARYLSRVPRRLLIAVASGLLVIAAVVIPATGQANASAQTCTGTPGGVVCTAVSGTSNYVSYIDAAWFKGGPPWICNYSAWFYYVPPSGGAYGLAYLSRAGCGYAHVWLDDYVYRTFPHNTLICVKFYENGGASYDGTDCVGLS